MYLSSDLDKDSFHLPKLKRQMVAVAEQHLQILHPEHLQMLISLAIPILPLGKGAEWWNQLPLQLLPLECEKGSSSMIYAKTLVKG